MNLRLIALLSATVVMTAGAVTTTIAAESARKPAAAGPASLQDVMKGKIAPAADVVWMAVGSVDDKDVKPETPAQWKKVRDAALVLASAPTLLAGPDLPIVRPGNKLQDEGQDGNLSSAEMKTKIAANRAEFAGYAKALQAHANDVVKAVDRKDADAIMEIGGAIDEACEACHTKFWYPGAK
jgi:cytochrome c556